MRIRTPSLLFFLLAGLLCAAPAALLAKTTLKMATLAPAKSSWDKVFQGFAHEVKNATDGEVIIKIYNGGVQGDEEVVVRKMKSGQLDGAAVTAVGLSKISPNVLVLQLPGLFRSYKELDMVRARMHDRLVKEFSDRDYVFLGWGDVGFAYLFTNTPVKTPSDVKNVKMWAWSSDPIASVLVKAAGGNPIPLSVPDVMPNLQTGLINAFYASPLAAIALRWFTKAKYMTAHKVAAGIGASVITRKSWNKLSPEHQDIVQKIAKKWHTKLVKKVRKDNKKSLKVLKGQGIELVSLSAAEVKLWEAVALSVHAEMTKKIFPKALLDEVKSHLSAARK